MTDQPFVIAFEIRNSETAEVEREYSVALEMPVVEVVTQGGQGPPGIPGSDGGSAFQRNAGETLSALRVVYELDDQVLALDCRDSAHIDLLLGLTLSASDPGQPLNIQRCGVLDDSGWNWQPGRIWLGTAGALTQTPPTEGFDVLIGAATSATRITLNIQDPIELE